VAYTEAGRLPLFNAVNKQALLLMGGASEGEGERCRVGEPGDSNVPEEMARRKERKPGAAQVEEMLLPWALSHGCLFFRHASPALAPITGQKQTY
jgi:hypothetical protein